MIRIIFSIIYVFSIITMGISIGWLFLRGNKNKITYSFVACQILIILWSLAQILHMESITERQIYISYLIGNIGVCFIGVFLIIFSYFYINKPLNKLKITWLLLIALFNYVSMATNRFHFFYYKHFGIDGVVHGPIFYFSMIFTYLCALIGISNIYLNHYKQKNQTKEEIFLLALAVITPLVFNAIYILNIFNTQYDITSLAFGLSSILVLLSTYKYGFLNINSIAFEKIVENISEGIIVLNKKGQITYKNESAIKYLNDEFENYIKDIYDEIERFISSKSKENEKSFINKEIFNGDKKVSVSCYSHLDNKNRVMAITVIISDVSKYYELIDKNKELAHTKQVLAIETERNRIAQEVHDTVGHTLTMINSLAKISKIKINKNENIEEYIRQSETLASEGLSQLRKSINNLKEKANEILLSEKIKSLVNSIKAIDIEFLVQGEDNDNYIKYSEDFYDTCRELITNSLRYAKATRINIIIRFSNDCIEMYVFDNGEGCEEIKYGNGLQGIINRMNRLNATYEFNTSKGNGFTSVFKVKI